MPIERIDYEIIIKVSRGKTDDDELNIVVLDNCEDDAVRKTLFHALFLARPELYPYRIINEL